MSYIGTPVDPGLVRKPPSEIVAKMRERVKDSGPLSQARRESSRKDEVRDESGRQRFHGAFTGGFSAGYYNTVGSKEGWKPSTFTSSRKARSEHTQQSALDFMDAADVEEMSQIVQTQSSFDHTPVVQSESVADSLFSGLFGGAAMGIGGLSSSKPSVSGSMSGDNGLVDDPVFSSGFTQSSQTSRGLELLQLSGWRRSQPFGPQFAIAAHLAILSSESHLDEGTSQPLESTSPSTSLSAVESIVRGHRRPENTSRSTPSLMRLLRRSKENADKRVIALWEAGTARAHGWRYGLGFDPGQLRARTGAGRAVSVTLSNPLGAGSSKSQLSLTVGGRQSKERSDGWSGNLDLVDEDSADSGRVFIDSLFGNKPKLIKTKESLAIGDDISFYEEDEFSLPQTNDNRVKLSSDQESIEQFARNDMIDRSRHISGSDFLSISDSSNGSLSGAKRIREDQYDNNHQSRRRSNGSVRHSSIPDQEKGISSQSSFDGRPALVGFELSGIVERSEVEFLNQYAMGMDDLRHAHGVPQNHTVPESSTIMDSIKQKYKSSGGDHVFLESRFQLYERFYKTTSDEGINSTEKAKDFLVGAEMNFIQSDLGSFIPPVPTYAVISQNSTTSNTSLLSFLDKQMVFVPTGHVEKERLEVNKVVGVPVEGSVIQSSSKRWIPSSVLLKRFGIRDYIPREERKSTNIL